MWIGTTTRTVIVVWRVQEALTHWRTALPSKSGAQPSGRRSAMFPSGECLCLRSPRLRRSNLKHPVRGVTLSNKPKAPLLLKRIRQDASVTGRVPLVGAGRSHARLLLPRTGGAVQPGPRNLQPHRRRRVSQSPAPCWSRGPQTPARPPGAARPQTDLSPTKPSGPHALPGEGAPRRASRRWPSLHTPGPLSLSPSPPEGRRRPRLQK